MLTLKNRFTNPNSLLHRARKMFFSRALVRSGGLLSGRRYLGTTTCTITAPRTGFVEWKTIEGRRKYAELQYVRIGEFEGFFKNAKTGPPVLYLIPDGREQEYYVSTPSSFLNTKCRELMDNNKGPDLHVRFYVDSSSNGSRQLAMCIQAQSGDDTKVYTIWMNKVTVPSKVVDVRLKTLDVFVSNDLKDRVDLLYAGMRGHALALSAKIDQMRLDKES